MTPHTSPHHPLQHCSSSSGSSFDSYLHVNPSGRPLTVTCRRSSRGSSSSSSLIPSIAAYPSHPRQRSIFAHPDSHPHLQSTHRRRLRIHRCHHTTHVCYAFAGVTTLLRACSTFCSQQEHRKLPSSRLMPLLFPARPAERGNAHHPPAFPPSGSLSVLRSEFMLTYPSSRQTPINLPRQPLAPQRNPKQSHGSTLSSHLHVNPSGRPLTVTCRCSNLPNFGLQPLMS